MLQQFHSVVDPLLGLNIDPQDLTFGQMTARAFVVFVATLVMLRLAHKRFFARRNTLDVVLAVIIASVLARAINGGAAFFPTLAVGFGFVFLHRLLSWAAARFAWIGRLVKGTPALLIDEGQVDTAALQRHDITLHDLQEDVRLNGIDRLDAVRLATLERNGEVSVIKKPSVPHE